MKIKRFISIILFLFITGFSQAGVIKIITANISWSSITGCSGPGGLPNSTDEVDVKNNAVITIDVNNAVANVIGLGYGGGSAGTGTLLFNTGSKLDLSGGTSGQMTLGVGGGQNGILDMTSGGTLICKTFSGSINPVITSGSGTIQVVGTATLPAAVNTYNNLQINAAGGTVTLGAGITMNGTLQIMAGTLTTSASNYALSVTGTTTISSGATLNVNASAVTFKGDFSDAGTFTYGTSTATINGTTDQTITNTAGETFYNLTINKASGDMVIEGSSTVTVINTLTMTTGNINLDGRTLTLGTAAATPGTLTYSGGLMYTSTSSGGFQRWVGTSAALTSSTGLFPVGIGSLYRPLTITSTASPTTGGTITVYHINNGGTTAVSPTFVDNGGTVSLMSTSTHSVSQSSLALGAGQSFSLQIAGTGYGTIGNVNDIRIVLSAGTIAPGTDGAHGGTTSNPQANRTGLSAANLNNIFTLGSVNSTSSPLPIELLSFEAIPDQNKLDLGWSTATEVNNDYFTVEKSKDGVNFEIVGTVKGSGNKTCVSNYSIIDDNPYKGVSYYRLKQTDFDGKFTYSDLVAVEFKGSSDFNFNVYPNPSDGQDINLSFMSSKGSEVLIEVYNASGLKCYSRTMVAQNDGENALALDPVNELSAGIYFVTVRSEQSAISKKLIVR